MRTRSQSQAQSSLTPVCPAFTAQTSGSRKKRFPLRDVPKTYKEIKSTTTEKDMKSRKRRLPFKPNKSPCSYESSLSDVPLEVKLNILSYLIIPDLCKMVLMSRSWRDAVYCHLKMASSLCFTDPDDPYANMPSKLNDFMLTNLLSKCQSLVKVKGFHATKIHYRESFLKDGLTYHGIVTAFSKCDLLKYVETSDLNLLTKLCLINDVTVDVFKNRHGTSPPALFPKYQLLALHVRELELYGITVDCLPSLETVEKLHLQCIRFTSMGSPFDRLHCPNLKSFMLNDCCGRSLEHILTYVSLCTNLASCRNLEVLHLANIPIHSRLIRRVVEGNWQRLKPFSNLKKLVLSGNNQLHEDDIGVLILASQKSLEMLYIQKSLTKDIVFLALQTAQPSFWSIKSVKLGYIDELCPKDDVAKFILDDRPCQLSDSGMKAAAVCFFTPDMTRLSVNECPHLNNPLDWIPQQGITQSMWSDLTELTLSNLPRLSKEQLVEFLPKLPSLKILNLIKLFPLVPKGCSRVGLSASGCGRQGRRGIRDIISQPPILAQNPLSKDDVLEQLDDLDTSEDENPERALKSRGFRTSQVHFGCSTTSTRIRRAFVRQAIEAKRSNSQAEHPQAQAASNTSSDNASASGVIPGVIQPLRRSRRLRYELPLDAAQDLSESSSSEELSDMEFELIVQIPRQRIHTGNARRSPGHEQTRQLIESSSTQSVSYITPSSTQNKSNNTNEHRVVTDTDDDEENHDGHHRHICHVCKKVMTAQLSLPQPSSLKLLPERNVLHNRANHRTGPVITEKICTSCIKQRVLQNNSVYTKQLVASRNVDQDPTVYMVFDSSTGVRCVNKPRQKKSTSSRHKTHKTHCHKGKQPMRMSSDLLEKGENFKVKSSKNKPDILRRYSLREHTGPKGTGASHKEPQAKKSKWLLTAEKCVGTTDPFIEEDLEQVFCITSGMKNLMSLNVQEVGLTSISLPTAANLASFTAHGCLVLREVEFCKERSFIPSQSVRITQCPKMVLTHLLESLSAARAPYLNDDLPSSVRSIEFEPMYEINREEVLVDLSRLPETNKVMIECTGTPKTDAYRKFYYENLLRDMSRSGNACYTPQSEFKVFIDLDTMSPKSPVVISHNIPSCRVKLTPNCDFLDCTDSRCMVTSKTGHVLYGATNLCFLYKSSYV